MNFPATRARSGFTDRLLSKMGAILPLKEGGKRPLLVAFFLLGGLLLVGLFTSLVQPVRGGEKGIWGGPVTEPNNRNLLAWLESQPRIGSSNSHEARVDSKVSFLVATLDAFGETPGFAPRTEFTTYKVMRGDTPGKIAAKFGISLDTLLKANADMKAKSLRIGMLLQVPPVSGTVYTIKEKDTIESISELFAVSSKDIGAANPSVNAAQLTPGMRLIIPGTTKRVADSGNPLPVLKGYFTMPASGFNWGKLHPENAVDIAGVCGTPVVAAAEGLVIPDEKHGNSTDGWNGGYGNFVLLEHPAGANVRTRYAHLRSVSVEVGDYVRQGQDIGTMGDTGDASGCHVHFEVHGVANPFVK